MRELEIRVPGPQGTGKARSIRPPGGNVLHRMSHWQVRKAREIWAEATMRAASISVAGQPWSPVEHCFLEVTWICKVRRRRDFDNLVSGLKPLLDGLVGAGIIRDDSTDCVMRLGPLEVKQGETDEILLRVRECGTDGMIRMTTPRMRDDDD